MKTLGCTLNIKFVAGMLTVTCIIASILIASAQTSCDNMQASTLTKDACSICIANGPEPANPGASCSFYTASIMVFCDCAPRVNCMSAGSLGVNVTVTLYTGGTCGGIVCGGAVFNSSWNKVVQVRYSKGCP